MRTGTRILLVGMIGLAGCYRATIDTGVTPSNVVIKKHWASGWIFGLVPPSTVATASRCPTGVAKIETRLGFQNQLVSILTLSIYTPMDIQVTCAEAPAASSAMTIPDSASTSTWQAALVEAADEAKDAEAPVYLQITH